MEAFQISENWFNDHKQMQNKGIIANYKTRNDIFSYDNDTQRTRPGPWKGLQLVYSLEIRYKLRLYFVKLEC
jgi:hypothetical protein